MIIKRSDNVLKCFFSFIQIENVPYFISFSSLLDLMTLNLSHVALSTGMFFTKFELDQPIHTELIGPNVFTADSLYHFVTLTFDLERF